MRSFLKLVTVLFPVSCIICGKKGSSYICGDCIPNAIDCYCLKCGMPSDGMVEECRWCRGKSFFFDQVHVLYDYESIYPILWDFKYRGSLRSFFAIKLLINSALSHRKSYSHIWNLFKDIDVITFVPIHVVRFFKREFNQSEVIANIVSDFLKNVKVNKILVKTRNIVSQTKLSRLERQKNVKGVFKVISCNSISGKTVLLVDDVATTLSTVNEASKVLKECGASRVKVLCLARDV